MNDFGVSEDQFVTCEVAEMMSALRSVGTVALLFSLLYEGGPAAPSPLLTSSFLHAIQSILVRGARPDPPAELGAVRGVNGSASGGFHKATLQCLSLE